MQGALAYPVWQLPRQIKDHVPFSRCRNKQGKCRASANCEDNKFRSGRRILLGGMLLVPFSLETLKARADETGQNRLGEGEEPHPNPVITDDKSTVKPVITEDQTKVKPVVTKDKSRIYDSTVLGEPVIVKTRDRIWEKLLASRVVYLGEAERLPDPEDKVLEVEIISTLREKCFAQRRPVTVALQAFPCILQASLNQYMNKSFTDEDLKGLVKYWPEGRWEKYAPVLQYCRDNGVRLMASGAPPEIVRIVEAKGVLGLSTGDRKRYVPPAGAGSAASLKLFQQTLLPDVFPKASAPFGPGPYRFAQARIVEDYTMSQVVSQATADAGIVGLVVVITGASHVQYGIRGSGLPARVSRKLQKKKNLQTVVLLNPEKQRVRQEGELPQADFLWYSSDKVCERNCFDRAEVARVMTAAGRRRDALPEDIKAGLDRGIISPELLQSFFEIDKQPLVAELTKRFQGLRERLLADPRFLQRLAIEEAISITTTLIAQYERRKDRFWKELDYVITDTVRGSVVDFFTVWLPAPRLAFRPLDGVDGVGGAFHGLQDLLGAVPDNAFQRNLAGTEWGLGVRVVAVLVGGLKLFSVGFISSVGTLSGTNWLLDLRRKLNPDLASKVSNKQSPIFKTAFVYASFLGLSANLRYQFVAGVVEHWIADYFLASTPLAGGVLSFVARTANSYWGTQQWVDLARTAGLQAHKEEAQEQPEQQQLEVAKVIEIKK